ncbi:MAG TPA: glutamate-ammonia-ligase adenylyltransferase, partial [Syntrophobacteria bacterium]|nr:glutamate-ammonia-ligase adenylyltransferase [Syntrophobacteria bacterium]
MKPTFDQVKAACPGIDDGLIHEHIARLTGRYFYSFPADAVYRHLTALARLSPDHPVEVLFESGDSEIVACTVLGFDYPALFSLITGILAGIGFNILSGDVFTYERTSAEAPKETRRRRRQGLPSRAFSGRRRIVDHFAGEVATPLSSGAWAAELKTRLEEIIVLLERGESDLAKHRVNEMVVARLAQLQQDAAPALYPVEIEVDNTAPSHTRLKIFSEDTPAFLYSLTNALSLHGISIEHVRIRTFEHRIKDELDIVDGKGNKIEAPEILSSIRLSVLLTKQFTYFLAKAPDPYAALRRFEFLVRDMIHLPGRERWLAILSNPHTLQDLARLLGTSDYLWEDFIRLHYETLLPMLKPLVAGERFSDPVQSIPERLGHAMIGASTLEDQRQRLNAFKDREIFLIDLDHILSPEMEFSELAERLTALAEQVVATAACVVYDHLARRYGIPRSAAGLQARFTILGLGKLGGAALGYASDIEFLVVYSDSGWTDGEDSIANSEFFDRLARNISQFIEAKREGIFHVDLRLRPYGSAGPLASSLESFCRYYGPGGDALSYERLALVRLRYIGGDKTLGTQVERIRDELIYPSQNIDLKELRELREKQFIEKTAGGKLNAKFSPGGLVDLEYDIQILQVMYGKQIPAMRTPLLHQALMALARAGVLSSEEADQLIEAYRFLRRLINSMRILRGSAQDLFLPPVDSVEFAALARRTGYRRGGALDPSQQLRLDFETHTAAVRAFAERHFGRDSLPGPDVGTVADLVLSENPPPDLLKRILTAAGFTNVDRAYINVRSLAGSGSRRQTFARLSLLASDILARTPDPDMALNNWERFIRALTSPEFHYNLLLSQPMRLEILLTILAGSQFLADVLVRNPGFLDWITLPENLHQSGSKDNLQKELLAEAYGGISQLIWLNRLRRLRRREILRIGTRDMYLKVPTEQVMLELSTLADTLTSVALSNVWTRSAEAERNVPGDLSALADHFCILAFGKLGGRELNYSSDIDLMGIFDDSPTLAAGLGLESSMLKYLFTWVMERVTLDLSMHTEEGHAYRVDLRLRPYGNAGELVPSLTGLVAYYDKTAALWELQAALKLRPIAGNLSLGFAFLERLRPILLRRRRPEEIMQSIERMRSAAIKQGSRTMGPVGLDVKSGAGGLRDVEFLVQGLQLIHAADYPELLEGNTLAALKRLCDVGLLEHPVAEQLRHD